MSAGIAQNDSAPVNVPFSKLTEAAALVAEMTLEEKAELCSGGGFWHTKKCERLGVPRIMMTDGPHGLRKQQGSSDHVGLGKSVPATCFPTASALASSWDVGLLHEIGVGLGETCTEERVSVILGPGMNIKRHPLCGRNFEYFSEDPLLSGSMAAALIDGVQSRGVGTSIKHFAVNNQESCRMFADAIIDERTMREIYLRGFEIAVRRAQPWTIMCAYNRINGTYCSDHQWLLSDVLRDEWGFEGLVVTDWGAMNDRVQGIRAGLDLEMPSSAGLNDRLIVAAVRAGELDESLVDRCVARVVALILSAAERPEGVVADKDAQHQLARRAAAESAVLLKNDGGHLPLQRKQRIAVIGAFAVSPRYQGAGSSQIVPTQLDNARDAIEAAVGASGEVSYAAGYDPERTDMDEGLIAEAVEVAKGAETVVLFVGLPSIYESEGFDRDHMRLPEQHDRLVEAVCAVNPATTVVLSNGAPVEMPWIERPAAVLEGYLAGQAGGTAVADLLFGDVNPSGKLAETFPLELSDVAADQWFAVTNRQVHYREGLLVGYRDFDTLGKEVRFPFGHGLSYTRFAYDNLDAGRTLAADQDALIVRLDVSNVGEVAGAEVVQVYVHHESSAVPRPEQALVGFAKVRLQPGESRAVEIAVPRSSFAHYAIDRHGWVVDGGRCEIRVGASSRDIRLRAMVEVEADAGAASSVAAAATATASALASTDEAFAALLGRPIPAPESPRPFHANSSLGEVATTMVGRRFRAVIEKQMSQQAGGSAEMSETNRKMMKRMVDESPLRSLALFSGGRLDFRAVNLLVAVLNRSWGEVWRTLRKKDSEGGGER